MERHVLPETNIRETEHLLDELGKFVDSPVYMVLKSSLSEMYENKRMMLRGCVGCRDIAGAAEAASSMDLLELLLQEGLGLREVLIERIQSGRKD